MLFYFLIKGGATVSICRSGSSPSVKTFYNNGLSSTFLDSSNPSFGLSNMIVNVIGSNLTCSFDRVNVISKTNYLQIGSSGASIYVITAYGPGKYILYYYIFNLFKIALNQMMYKRMSFKKYLFLENKKFKILFC